MIRGHLGNIFQRLTLAFDVLTGKRGERRGVEQVYRPSLEGLEITRLAINAMGKQRLLTSALHETGSGVLKIHYCVSHCARQTALCLRARLAPPLMNNLASRHFVMWYRWVSADYILAFCSTQRSIFICMRQVKIEGTRRAWGVKGGGERPMQA